MRVLVDTNVVLDVLLARHPFVHASASVMGQVEQSKITGFLCATTVTTIDYLLAQAMPRAAARETLGRLLALFEVAPVTRAVLEEASTVRSRILRTRFWTKQAASPGPKPS